MHLIGRGRYAREAYPMPPALPPSPSACLSPTVTRIVNVNKGGSDSTGDGTICKPFLTIERAYDSITDAALTNRYGILVGPGQYPDPFDFKPWVQLASAIDTGAANGADANGEAIVEVSCPANSLHFDPAWGTTFADAWFAGLAFTNPQTFDEGDVAGCKPQLNFFGCVINGAFGAGPGVNIQSPGNVGTNNYLFEGCLIYNGATARGVNFLWLRNTTTLGGTILAQAGPSPTATTITKLLAMNCSLGAALSPTAVHILWDASSPVGIAATGDFSNTDMVGVFTLDGAHVSAQWDGSGAPSGATFVNGAASTDLTWNQFNPAVLANWTGVRPYSLANALDRIAAKVGPIP